MILIQRLSIKNMFLLFLVGGVLCILYSIRGLIGGNKFLMGVNISAFALG